MNDVYYVWSNEHRAWWGPGHRGYVRELSKAGWYTREAALDICRNALGTAMHMGMFAELPVRREDVNAFLDGQLLPRGVI